MYASSRRSPGAINATCRGEPGRHTPGVKRVLPWEYIGGRGCTPKEVHRGAWTRLRSRRAEDRALVDAVAWRHEAALVGLRDELCAVARSELHCDAADVRLGRGRTDEQLGGDLAIGQTMGH